MTREYRRENRRTKRLRSRHDLHVGGKITRLMSNPPAATSRWGDRRVGEETVQLLEHLQEREVAQLWRTLWDPDP